MTNEATKLTTHQKQLAREHAGNGKPEDDCFDYVEGALGEVSRLVAWLGYVVENEYTATEKAKLIASAKRFAKIAQPIASKYLD